MPRDYAHNYKSRCIYHITMTKTPGVPQFSIIAGTPEQPIVERNDESEMRPTGKGEIISYNSNIQKGFL